MIVFSDVILQMIKKVFIRHLFLFIRRQQSIREVSFGIIITDFTIINNVVLTCILGEPRVIGYLELFWYRLALVRFLL
jgi:hypothetical protein